MIHKHFTKFIGKIQAYDPHFMYFPLYFQGSEGGSFIVLIIISSSSTLNCCFNAGCRDIKESVTSTLKAAIVFTPLTTCSKGFLQV